jgi:nucleotide-binding universal stress UspA family protein
MSTRRGKRCMYERILMPVDGSPGSDAALDHGLRLAKDQGAQVRIIHVVDVESLYTYTEGVYVGGIEEAWRRRSQTILALAMDQARRADVQAENSAIEARGQRVADVIVAESQRARADLIVMGTHGRHGAEHLLLGSVAEGVVRITAVPVLLVRRP